VAEYVTFTGLLTPSDHTAEAENCWVPSASREMLEGDIVKLCTVGAGGGGGVEPPPLLPPTIVTIAESTRQVIRVLLARTTKVPATEPAV
jgi:hypothetical protein